MDPSSQNKNLRNWNRGVLMPTAAELIAVLQLQPLPLEGGYYRETYRSADAMPFDSFPQGGATRKSMATAIYYLLTADTFSALHRLPTDEIYHHYFGDSIQVVQLFPDGSGSLVELGSDILAGQHPQVVVPAGTWQGSFVAPGGSHALLGTTMSPGFDFTDFEPGDRETLLQKYPSFASLIERLTRTT
jgi:predicted cupin superfamily sugar epimerase